MRVNIVVKARSRLRNARWLLRALVVAFGSSV
jgi:hypothetical protein